MIRYQLTIVLVRSHHISSDTLIAGFCCQSSDYIVRFISRYLQDGDSVSLDNIFYNRYRKTDCFRSFFSLSFVLFKSFVAECGSRWIECNSNVGGVLFLQHLFQGVDESQYG